MQKMIKSDCGRKFLIDFPRENEMDEAVLIAAQKLRELKGVEFKDIPHYAIQYKKKQLT